MTTNRFQKAAIRSRMQNTGEPYSVAAREIALLPTVTWPKLDEAMSGGFQNASLYIIGARPGVGRASVGFSLAARLSKPNNNVLYFNLERTHDEANLGLVNAVTKIEIDSERKLETAILLQQLSKKIKIETGRQTIQSIRTIVESAYKPDAVIVDYFELIEEPITCSSHEFKEHIARELKALALEFNIPIIVLSQLHRSSKPENSLTLASNSWNTALVAFAEVVMLLTRAEDDSFIHFSLVKNRQGALGSIALNWPSLT